jgi:hypothetical protein
MNSQTFEWVIQNASIHMQQAEGPIDICLRSNVFSLHGRWWVAKFYLRGDPNDNVEDNEFGQRSTVDVVLLSDTSNGAYIANLGVELDGAPVVADATAENKCNFSTGRAWGFSRFVAWENLTSCIKSDDTFRLKVTITKSILP